MGLYEDGLAMMLATVPRPVSREMVGMGEMLVQSAPESLAELSDADINQMLR
jgi:hypothetical protein